MRDTGVQKTENYIEDRELSWESGDWNSISGFTKDPVNDLGQLALSSVHINALLKNGYSIIVQKKDFLGLDDRNMQGSTTCSGKKKVLQMKEIQF